MQVINSRNPGQPLLSVNQHTQIIASNVTLVLGDEVERGLSLTILIQMATKYQVQTNILANELSGLGETNFTEAKLNDFGRNVAARVKTALAEIEKWNPKDATEAEAKKRALDALRDGRLTETEQILKEDKLPFLVRVTEPDPTRPPNGSWNAPLSPGPPFHGAEVQIAVADDAGDIVRASMNGIQEYPKDYIPFALSGRKQARIIARNLDEFNDTLVVTNVRVVHGLGVTSNLLGHPVILSNFGDFVITTNQLWFSSETPADQNVSAWMEGIDKHDGINATKVEQPFSVTNVLRIVW